MEERGGLVSELHSRSRVGILLLFLCFLLFLDKSQKVELTTLTFCSLWLYNHSLYSTYLWFTADKPDCHRVSV